MHVRTQLPIPHCQSRRSARPPARTTTPTRPLVRLLVRPPVRPTALTHALRESESPGLPPCEPPCMCRAWCRPGTHSFITLHARTHTHARTHAPTHSLTPHNSAYVCVEYQSTPHLTPFKVEWQMIPECWARVGHSPGMTTRYDLDQARASGGHPQFDEQTTSKSLRKGAWQRANFKPQACGI